ncbi:MAG: 3' terminal RNA ribose 2'-O-methyltransferase Hen1 [Nitrospira sp.]|nr:3' terminal RNA ribose 2'-O-methyltransferase Hen1 [Nitrospira sp.]
MLLTIATTAAPATDLGYLLHKNPSRVHEISLSFGKAHVFYPEAKSERCTAALLLDLDPVGLVRNRRGPAGEGRALEQYVNDRPYVASSFMSVALSQVFGTAMTGRSKERQELANRALPFEVQVSVVPCRGGESVLRKIFEPLGYSIKATRYPLDETFPEWGESPYFTVELKAELRLKELLAHLYVLLPVLDDDKHYWVGHDELEKLLHHGGEWLAAHPERELIVQRYLKYQKRLTRQALAQLVEDDQSDPDAEAERHATEEAVVEERITLNQQRQAVVIAALKSIGAKRVLDLGCGEGKLLRNLLEDKTFAHVAGMDVSYRALEIAQERLHLDRLQPKQKERTTLFQGALTYRDARLEGFDAAMVIEVIEHLDPHRLSSFERVLFETAKPRAIVLTTPNAEYNVRFETLPAGKLRHKDHRFEWTRQQFQEWASDVARRFGYLVRFLPVGPEDPVVGAPTQMAIFTRVSEPKTSVYGDKKSRECSI